MLPWSGKPSHVRLELRLAALLVMEAGSSMAINTSARFTVRRRASKLVVFLPSFAAR